MSDHLYEQHPRMFKSNPVGFILSILLVAAFGLGAVILLIWWLRVKNTVIIIDAEKTILRKGVLSKQTNEVYHSDVRNIQVFKSFFQRMFDVGSLQVSSAGQGSMEISITGVPKPAEAQSIINDHRDDAQNNGTGSASGKSSTADELQKLANLKDQGILTDSEFQKQKDRLLN